MFFKSGAVPFTNISQNKNQAEVKKPIVKNWSNLHFIDSFFVLSFFLTINIFQSITWKR